MVEATKQVYAPTRGGLAAAVRRPLRVLEGVGQPVPSPRRGQPERPGSAGDSCVPRPPPFA